MRLIILIFVVWSCVLADLPTELDPFMEKLFETEECESFISGEFTSVATSDCEPYMCDFPRQFCVRPAAKYTDKSANMCKDIPSDCLTAANGGVPLGPPMTSPAPLIMPAPQPEKKGKKGRGGGGGGGGRGFPGRLVTGRPTDPHAICDMDPPTGRFCGFKVMYTYNKENFACDEFWFPGCRTAETNDNLFADYHDCQKVAEICKPTHPPTTTPPPPPPTFPTFPPMTPPPPPPPQPHKPKGGWGSMGQGAGQGQGMGQGGGAGLAGLAGLGGLSGFLGSGSGSPAGGGGGGGAGAGGGSGGDGGEEDLGLVGLIQKGLVSAQAINKGGKHGKEAAAAAAGQFLQQFTGFDINNIGGNFGNFFNGR